MSESFISLTYISLFLSLSEFVGRVGGGGAATLVTSTLDPPMLPLYCGTLWRVYCPLCHSELANNSERTVWFSLYATSLIRELKEQSLKENCF